MQDAGCRGARELEQMRERGTRNIKRGTFKTEVEFKNYESEINDIENAV